MNSLLLLCYLVGCLAARIILFLVVETQWTSDDAMKASLVGANMDLLMLEPKEQPCICTHALTVEESKTGRIALLLARTGWSSPANYSNRLKIHEHQLVHGFNKLALASTWACIDRKSYAVS